MLKRNQQVKPTLALPTIERSSVIAGQENKNSRDVDWANPASLHIRHHSGLFCHEIERSHFWPSRYISSPSGQLRSAQTSGSQKQRRRCLRKHLHQKNMYTQLRPPDVQYRSGPKNRASQQSLAGKHLILLTLCELRSYCASRITTATSSFDSCTNCSSARNDLLLVLP